MIFFLLNDSIIEDDNVFDEYDEIKQKAKAKRLQQRKSELEREIESIGYPSPSWKYYDPGNKRTQEGWI